MNHHHHWCRYIINQGRPSTSVTIPSTETPKLPPFPDQKSLSATSGSPTELGSQATDGDAEEGYGVTIDEGGAEEVLLNSINCRSTLTDASHVAEIFLNDVQK